MNEPLATEIAEHIPRMYRVALRMLGCPEAAKDIAQNVCVLALRGAQKFAGRSDLATWLHRITVNCARDHLRRSCRRDRDRADWDCDTLSMLVVLDAGPAEQAERKETYILALNLVAKLPDDCRTAFVLTQLDGYTYDEAAAIENLSRGTIASRVYRARKILITQMNDHLAGDMP
jgi:RNA polymerase sigma-70 factor, ECF subfamily